MQVYLASHPVLAKALAGAVAGFGGAVLVDYAEFRKWKSFDDALTYNWSVAAFRWVQGAVGGVVAAFGYDALV